MWESYISKQVALPLIPRPFYYHLIFVLLQLTVYFSKTLEKNLQMESTVGILELIAICRLINLRIQLFALIDSNGTSTLGSAFLVN